MSTTGLAPSAEILNQIESTWLQGRAHYRDALLQVGLLLQDFLAARATEVAGLTSRMAFSLGICREKAIQEAAKRLRINRNRIYALLATAQAQRLLGSPEGPGGLSYSAICAFRFLVRRKPDPKSGEFMAAGALEAFRSIREQWELKVIVGLDSRALFHQAVLEKWPVEKIRLALAPYGRAKPKPSAHEEFSRPSERPSIVQLRDLARTATPKDLAQIILELIRSSEDPLAVQSALEASLGHPGAGKRSSYSW